MLDDETSARDDCDRWRDGGGSRRLERERNGQAQASTDNRMLVPGRSARAQPRNARLASRTRCHQLVLLTSWSPNLLFVF
jgi:hypothetical protein